MILFICRTTWIAGMLSILASSLMIWPTSKIREETRIIEDAERDSTQLIEKNDRQDSVPRYNDLDERAQDLIVLSNHTEFSHDHQLVRRENDWPSWDQAVQGGNELVCLMNQNLDHAGDALTPQSRWTDVQDLKRYGWRLRAIPCNELGDLLLTPVFEELGISTDLTDWVEVEARHWQSTTHVDEAGEPKEYPETRAAFVGFFNIKDGVIIVTALYGPKASTKYRSVWAGEDLRDDQLVPLKQWSDVTWLTWTWLHDQSPATIGTVSRINHIFHEGIINPESMDRIQEATGRSEDPPPWPGQVWPIKDDQAKALLTTPNGRGTAWLLIQHKDLTQLNRKIVRQVRTFSGGVPGRECLDKWYLHFEIGQGPLPDDQI